MFGWIYLPCAFATEQAYRVLELLKQHRLPCRMPSDDMFFSNAYRLPHPDLRWQICVRRWDLDRATALLVKEGLINGATLADRAEQPGICATPASPAAARRRTRRGTARSGCRDLPRPARRAPGSNIP